jgi:hypothetical protein
MLRAGYSSESVREISSRRLLDTIGPAMEKMLAQAAQRPRSSTRSKAELIPRRPRKARKLTRRWKHKPVGARCRPKRLADLDTIFAVSQTAPLAQEHRAFGSAKGAR